MGGRHLFLLPVMLAAGSACGGPNESSATAPRWSDIEISDDEALRATAVAELEDRFGALGPDQRAGIDMACNPMRVRRRIDKPEALEVNCNPVGFFVENGEITAMFVQTDAR